MSGLRPIVSRTRATVGGPLKRLVGTVDCDGSGLLHPLHDVDPFVLCDVAKIPKANLPDFGMHPHFGCIACSVIVEGGLKDRDSVTGGEKLSIESSKSGDVYAASAGRGLYHEEVTAGPSYLLQVIVRIPRAKLDLPPCVLKASDFPVTTEKAKLLIGTFEDQTSSATPPAWPDAVMLRVKAKDTPILTIPSKYPHGFCFALYGSGKVCGEPLVQDEVIVFGKENEALSFEADTEDFEVFIGTGAPLPEPWVKLKGNNGFGIFINDIEARDVMSRAAAVGETWNYLTPS